MVRNSTVNSKTTVDSLLPSAVAVKVEVYAIGGAAEVEAVARNIDQHGRRTIIRVATGIQIIGIAIAVIVFPVLA